MPQTMLSHAGTCTEVAIDTTASGDNTIVAGSAGKTIRIYSIILFANSANNLTLKDGASTKLMGVMNFTSNMGWDHDADDEGHRPFTLSAGNAFVINLSGATQVSGRVWYLVD